MTSPGGRIEIRVEPDLRGFGSRLSSGLSSAASAGVGAFASAAVTAFKVAGAAASVALAAGIKQGLSVYSFTEQAEISFETLLGSAQRAKDYLADLQTFAASTPFELPGVVSAARQLLGVGQSAESVIPTLTAWGDAAGALGLSQEQFERALLATTQAMSKGKVQAEELMQITEAGIPVYSLLSKALGLPVPELQRLASEGKLLAEDVFPALERQMNADYGGSMAAQAQTLSGVWSTAKDNINLALRDAVSPLAVALKTTIPDASGAAATAIREMGLRGSEGLLQLIERGRELASTYGPELAELGDAVAEKWRTFTELMSQLGSEVAPSIPHLVDALLRILQVGGELSEDLLPALKAGLKLAGPAADALAGAMSAVASVLETIEPVLPVVVGGLLALKGVSAARGALAGLTGALAPVSGGLQRLAQDAAFASYNMQGVGGRGAGALSTGLSKAAAATQAVGRALPVLAIVTAAAGYEMEKAEQQLDGWAQALLDGGQAADAARRQIADAAAELQSFTDIEETSGLAMFSAAGPAIAAAAAEADNLADTVEQRARDMYEAMSPLQQAQQDVTRATNELSQAQADHGVNSAAATNAAINLRNAEANLAQQQRDLETATRTATTALLEQTQAALAGANADLAASMANTQLATAQETYRAALADGTLTTTERQAATDAMTQSALQAAQAAGQQAFAHSQAATEEGKQAEADAALLASLQQTAQQLGANTPAAITNLIASLQASAGQGALTAAQMRDLGLSVQEIPGQKAVVIDAPTADQKRRIEDLGYVVTHLPNGQVVVTADTSSAQAALDAFVAQRRYITVYTNYAQGGPINGPARPGLWRGGLITGPGTWTSDSVPIDASNGEYLTRAAIVARVGVPTMDAFNRGDWATAAARLTQLAQQQARTSFASAAAGQAGRNAGRFAAGGYVDAQMIRASLAGAGGGVPQRVTNIENNLYAAPSLPTIDQLQRMQRRAEIMASRGRG